MKMMMHVFQFWKLLGGRSRPGHERNGLSAGFWQLFCTHLLHQQPNDPEPTCETSFGSPERHDSSCGICSSRLLCSSVTDIPEVPASACHRCPPSEGPPAEGGQRPPSASSACLSLEFCVLLVHHDDSLSSRLKTTFWSVMKE